MTEGEKKKLASPYRSIVRRKPVRKTSWSAWVYELSCGHRVARPAISEARARSQRVARCPECPEVEHHLGAAPNAGTRHGRAILTPELVEKIRLDPRPHTWVARMVGVTPCQIRRVRLGVDWKHVPMPKKTPDWGPGNPWAWHQWMDGEGPYPAPGWPLQELEARHGKG